MDDCRACRPVTSTCGASEGQGLVPWLFLLAGCLCGLLLLALLLPLPLLLLLLLLLLELELVLALGLPL